MSFYYDALARCIHNYLAQDIREAVAKARYIREAVANTPPLHLNARMDSIEVPLQADVQVAYEAGFARFAIHGRCSVYGRKEYLNVESFFDTRPIEKYEDAVAYVEFVFDQAKQRMLAQLAKDRFKEMLEKKPQEQPHDR